jgi:UDP-N-acetylglucosamine 2-epimerase (non-hydrolysing)
MVVGTRPEVIKILPLYKSLKLRGIKVKLISTGQQRELLVKTFLEFSLNPDVDFNLMKENQSPAEFMQEAMRAFNLLFLKYRPRYVIVHGDTSSATAAAISGFLNQISVVHIEAGLRSGNLLSPFPEEANRRLIDSLSTLHFAPSIEAVQHLTREGHTSTTIFSGNTIVDAINNILLEMKPLPTVIQNFIDKGPFVLITQHRRENFNTILPMVVDLIARLSREKGLRFIWPVHPNPNVQKLVRQNLGDEVNVLLLEPQDYIVTLSMLNFSALVITDSGGIQEEAAILGVPLAITRNETERREVLSLQNVLLVGGDQVALEEFIDTNLFQSVRNEPFTFKDYGEVGLSEEISNHIVIDSGYN